MSIAKTKDVATPSNVSTSGCQVIKFGRTKQIRQQKETPAEAVLKRYLAGAMAGSFVMVGVYAVTTDGVLHKDLIEVTP